MYKRQARRVQSWQRKRPSEAAVATKHHEPLQAEPGWAELAPGTRVEIRNGGWNIGRGTVDAVMPDGSVVWYWIDDDRLLIGPP